MSRIALPDNQWAELIEPRRMSEKKRRAYVMAMSAYGEKMPRDENGIKVDVAPSPEALALLDAAMDLLTAALVKAWSFDVEISVDSVQDLPIDTFDVLRAAVMVVQSSILPDYGVSPDPKAPTNGSTPPPTASPMAAATSTTP